MDFSIETLKQETAAVMEELFRNCSEGHYTLRKGDILVIGCSTSKVMGFHMGTHSTEDAARAIMETVLPYVHGKGLFLACQCCEHLNRAIVVERECMEKYDFEQVSVKPALHAGGAWSVQAMQQFTDPVVVEDIKMRARAGISAAFSSECICVRSAFRFIMKTQKSAAQMSPWHATAPSSSEAKEHSIKISVRNTDTDVFAYTFKRAVLHRSNR